MAAVTSENFHLKLFGLGGMHRKFTNNAVKHISKKLSDLQAFIQDFTSGVRKLVGVLARSGSAEPGRVRPRARPAVLGVVQEGSPLLPWGFGV
jgi:hypothetical protein